MHSCISQSLPAVESEADLCEALPGLDPPARARLRAALLESCAELLALRNPRFDLSRELP